MSIRSKSFSFLISLTLLSCTTTEADNRICVDYKSFTHVVERCKPFYGTLICADVEETKTICTRYEELRVDKTP